MFNRKRLRVLAWAKVASSLFVCATAQADPVDLQVISATVRDQPIAGAEVLLQKNGQASSRGRGDADGRYRGEAPDLSADDPAATLIVRKDGYSTLVARCPCNHLTYAMSPVMRQLDGMRIVLSWDATPLDLDAHLVFPSNHVYFNEPKGADATLDVDHRVGYGPETVTLLDRHPGQRYVYAVHDFEDRYVRGGNAMELGRTRVQLYVGQTLVRNYRIDPAMRGNLWTVFAINEHGGIEDIDAYADATAPEDVPAMLQPGTAQPAPPRYAGPAERAQALALNRDGEAAYARGDFDGAIALFQQALDYDPDDGQACSNLGLAFEKAGREAEAIWADRKAIALAHGDDAARVRASSSYNIGRIYETHREWAHALDSYQAAQDQRPSEVYSAAIARMQGKFR